jgi:hypothetical protein
MIVFKHIFHISIFYFFPYIQYIYKDIFRRNFVYISYPAFSYVCLHSPDLSPLFVWRFFWIFRWSIEAASKSDPLMQNKTKKFKSNLACTLFRELFLGLALLICKAYTVSSRESTWRCRLKLNKLVFGLRPVPPHFVHIDTMRSLTHYSTVEAWKHSYTTHNSRFDSMTLKVQCHENFDPRFFVNPPTLGPWFMG